MTGTIFLYAAGSLKAALSDVAKAFEHETGNNVELKFGPFGLLKDEIAGGAQAQVFASANMDHPQELHAKDLSGRVTRFARNTMCALVKPDLEVSSACLLELMLDPNVKLATSTPKADPSGDYAFEVFAKADAVRPGARVALEAKALQLTVQPTVLHRPRGATSMAGTWPSAAPTFSSHIAPTHLPHTSQQSVMLPNALAVAADYGLAVMKGAPAGAQSFAQFILSKQGQSILAGHGFAPATSP